jgi:hypothetical protein
MNHCQCPIIIALNQLTSHQASASLSVLSSCETKLSGISLDVSFLADVVRASPQRTGLFANDQSSAS